MKIIIFGANGQTGRLLTRQTLDAGHEAVAVTRSPHNFPFSDSGLTVAAGDVRSTEALPGVLEGADAVLSTLGVPMRMGAIDTYSSGAANIVAAMRRAAVRRLVVVSSTAVTDYPGRTGTPFALKFVEPILKSTLGRSTYADQRRMEQMVSTSGLAWTIVRPSGLFDLRQVTDYVAGHVDPVGAFTSRSDLAHYLLTLAQQQGPQATVTISTVTDTPTLWEMVRREAFPQPKNAAASS
ncbi:SDR family oxidoreductase [soil metagenome]